MKALKTTITALLLAFAATAGAQIPQVTLRDIDGKAVRTDTLRNNGKPFIIDFFATWCKPCNRELDAISEVYEEWKEETGITIYCVSIDQAHNVNKVRPLVDQKGWTYPVLLDPNSELLHAFGIQTIPHVILFDGDGKIAYRHSGYVDGAEDELLEEVRKLVAEKPETKSE